MWQKAIVRKWKHTYRSNSKSKWLIHLSNHDINGIFLHPVAFELFKKMLLVALGFWLSVQHMQIAGWKPSKTKYLGNQFFLLVHVLSNKQAKRYLSPEL